MDQVKEKSKKFNKTNAIQIIVLSVSLSFTVLFFSSAELFIRNQKDYLIDAWHILLPMFVAALFISVAAIVFLNIMLFIHETLYIVVSRLMAGLLLAFYVQEMFLNGKMSSITGDSFNANLETWEVVLNTAIFLLITILPLIGHFLRKKYPQIKLLQVGNEYIVPYFAGLIFIMQIFGIVGSIVQFGYNKYERLYDSYLSYETTMSLSKDKNITVFIVDRLDSFYMDEILKTYPDMYDELNGFTFYQNNIAHYTNTFPSVTYMLTGVQYEGEEWNDYFKRAWAEKSFIDDLKKNGFHVNLLIDNIATYSNYSDLKNKCDNLGTLNDSKYKFNYLGNDGIFLTMTKLSLGRIVPYFAKGMFINGIQSDFSSDFIYYYNDDIDDLMPGAVGVETDLLYYDNLKRTGLDKDNAKNTFSFIHLNGAHDASNELSELYSDKYKSGSFGTLSTARGDFEIIFEYIRQMKELGIYDNSTIIIVGDHGRPPHEIESKKLDHLESPIVTALMIKPENAKEGSLKLDPLAELSNDFLAASVIEYAGLDHSMYGYSYNDVIDNNLHIERIFQAMHMRGFGTINEIKFKSPYKIKGNARDFSNWKIED